MKWLMFFVDLWRKLKKQEREEWRHVDEPPNWRCRRGGTDYL